MIGNLLYIYLFIYIQIELSLRHVHAFGRKKLHVALVTYTNMCRIK